MPRQSNAQLVREVLAERDAAKEQARHLVSRNLELERELARAYQALTHAHVCNPRKKDDE